MFFTQLDLIAPPVGITIKGQEGLKTKAGSLISLAASGAFIASLVISIIALFDTSSPTASIDLNVTNVYPKINIAKGHLMPMILPFYDSTNPIPASEVRKYVTIVAYQFSFKTSTKTDGSFSSEYKLNQIATI